MSRTLALDPAAKINLHLEILGTRADGYHELRTLFQSIDLRDRLTVEAAPPGELTLSVEPADAVSAGDDNLVLRAARRLARHVGIEAGARFRLRKRIPVGGGLGGGSADAAAALLLADALWSCRLSDETLRRLAGELGSDVPFFLSGGLALGEGRGDEITELEDQPEAPLVVAVPAVRVSTADAYARYRPRLTSKPQEGTVYAFAVGLRGRPEWREMTNDLEHTVVSSWPEVGEGLRRLRAFDPLHVSLSGSGAASFAVFDRPEAAAQAAATLPASWFVHVGTTVRRSAARLEVEVIDGGVG